MDHVNGKPWSRGNPDDDFISWSIPTLICPATKLRPVHPVREPGHPKNEVTGLRRDEGHRRRSLVAGSLPRKPAV